MNLEEKTSADIYVFEVKEDDDSAAANVLRLVGTNKRVLEIGAGPGSIARPLVQRNRCSVTALEIDPNCLPILETFCDRVVAGDLNSKDWTTDFDQKSFEVIVIADVLEHLFNPWQALRLASTLLQDDGYIVCSIPNASHAVILAAFATDDVDYRNWGLLDRTHIRFFGAKNVQNLFNQAGLRIIDAQFVVRAPEVTEFAGLWERLPLAHRAVFESGPFAHVYQTVLVAALDARAKQAEFILETRAPPKRAKTLYHAATRAGLRQVLSRVARKLLTSEQRNAIKKMIGF